ncbi:MAG: ABC transporter ATP-binding protein [Anaerocolumna aminovalerica]|jgi:ATP-binding cassette subfamily B multidrug efflux pump|uniref:ABC transporter ATP-binding protein n=1 Tax=Anaerocolumna aminovalerica TaxID=1527 RepID=UPI00248C1590|nr:ABC transporter ATP-binding protein [Anaerocolumna aminovalerica]MDU6265913.1 ABC transporter ATP-binding protein [Anaerocolumna aminovalerica]
MKKNNIILKYLYRYKWKYFLGIITLFVVDFVNLYIPQFTGEITDGLESKTMNIHGVLLGIGKILIVGAILMIGRFLWRYFIFGSSRAIECEIRNDLFAHLEKLSMSYFNKNKTGDLMSHFTNDLNAVRMSIGPAVITTFDAVIMTLMVLIKMILYVDLRLTVLAVIPLLFIAVGGVYYGKAAEKKFTAKQQAFSDLTDQVQESISGIRVIKAFVQERKELKAFGKANKENKDKNMGVVKLQAVVMPSLDFIIGFSSVITLLYGGYLTIKGDITLGRFIAFNQYIYMLVWPMIAAGDSITFFSQGFASLKRIQNIFDEKPEIFDEDTVKRVEHLEGDIQIKDLCFQYNNDAPKALNNISVHIEKGSSLAILGRTGSGKTTLVNLLLRMYNVEPGQITLDGYDIREIPLKTLRENIAYVPQDNFLFSDTLRNNIAFGAADNDLEMVKQAAKEACIHENIMNFPLKYETVVGERGATLSGGQKQRSSIARAFMKDAPILILDDSLSAVDTNTEERILENLKKNREGKTTIIIAHRISTIQNADRILVLDAGEAAEYGTHEELLKLQGIYARMYEKQQLEKQLEAV